MTTPSLTGMVTCKNLQVNNLLGITRVLRTCNGAEYQVKNFLSMPIYAFHGANRAILGGISAGGYAVSIITYIDEKK